MILLRKPGSCISPSWLKFLWVYACFAVFTYFSGTFINTYLIRVTGSSQGVMIFNMLLAVVQPFVMLYAVCFIRKSTPLISQRIGLWLYAAVFAILGLLGEGAAMYIRLIAVLISAANGFFYTTYALQLLAYTTNATRDESYGLQNVIGGVIGIVIPALSGLLLSGFDSLCGYRMLFAIGLVITIVSILLSTRLDSVTNVAPRAEIKKAFRTVITDHAVLMAMLCSMANGFYAGTMSFFLNVLIYSLSGSEAVIGFVTTVGSVSMILSSIVYARVVRPWNRRKAIFVSLGVMLAASTVLIASISVTTLFVFSVLLSAMSAFFLNPPLTAYLGVIEQTQALKGLGGEVHAIREFWYGGGRVLGIIIAMIFTGLQHGAATVILIILSIQTIPAFLMKYMKTGEQTSKEM